MFIQAKNSLLFYGASAVYKPLATALLAHEMFNKRASDIKFRVGELIPSRALEAHNLADKALIKRLKKHLYTLGTRQKDNFVTEKAIAQAEDPVALRQELSTARPLGETRDGQSVHLCHWQEHPCVMRELGRLREMTFRKVGEGTGNRRDLDRYDQHYQHLVLWDANRLVIAGAYRIGVAGDLIRSQGLGGLYTAELFQLRPALMPYLNQSLELGRSFVNPEYWGKASLDYLWQGLGAYLQHHPQIRYLIGPVTLSADYPKPLQDWLVVYYQRFYSAPRALASARHPHMIPPETRMALNGALANLDQSEGFERLSQEFERQGYKLPALFKHYPMLFEEGGVPPTGLQHRFRFRRMPRRSVSGRPHPNEARESQTVLDRTFGHSFSIAAATRTLTASNNPCWKRHAHSYPRYLRHIYGQPGAARTGAWPQGHR